MQHQQGRDNMAKHPHLIQLIEGRTWKCMLHGCSFFVHMGLAHVMVGKRVICYECRETFEVTESALNMVKVRGGYIKCDECLDREFGTAVPKDTRDIEETPRLHANDCPAWLGSTCNCGVGDVE